MSISSQIVRGLLVAGVWTLAAASVPGCIGDDKYEPGKGEVDDSTPPGSPIAFLDGKADATGIAFAVSLESAHPYANNLNRLYTLDLNAIVPSCTTRVRAHFASLRTEAGYDYVQVIDPSGAVAQAFNGRQDGVWSEFVNVDVSNKKLNIRLKTDSSVTDHGFRIDGIEIYTGLRCPLPPQQACSAGYFDVTPSQTQCTCRGATQCAEDAWVEVSHSVGGGFTGQVTGRRLTGQLAQTTLFTTTGGESSANVGQLDRAAVQELVTAIVNSGIMTRTEVSLPSNWNETFTIRLGTQAIQFTRPQGSFPADEQLLINQFEALFGCDGLNAALTCGEGYSCNDNTCVENVGCVCPANYDPVCGESGHTFSNGCSAACAGAPVAHTGECGITGDNCGTIMGLDCLDGFKCRFGVSQYDYPFPDAGGECVTGTYCDAPADCTGLAHPTVPGAWACNTNACNWQAGPQWTAVAGSRLVTPHPYANNLNTWTLITLPAGGAKMRLVKTGTFELESGYDKLEVWAWRNGAWLKVKTYSGTVGPALADEWVGQSFYLHLVSDSSITKFGLDVSAESSN